MAKHAFVVGSATEGLGGPDGDAERMANALASYGFTVEACVGANATRDGIVAGYRKLIERCQRGDAAVFYYSGHGAYVENPDYRPGGAEARHWQCIVPVDFASSSEEDFRGIAAEELSLLQAELTGKTPNVTTILDCCHSAGMSRTIGALPKALSRPLRVGAAALAAHVRRLRETNAAQIAKLDPESNPLAVRVIATGLRDFAWEYEPSRGKRVGVMTESLLLALEEARGKRVSWQAIGNRVRERVLSLFPTQRPEIEGPAQRIVFECEELTANAAIPVVFDSIREQSVLRAGRIHGVHEGDEYTLLDKREKPIGRARVSVVGPAESDVAISPADLELPEGALASPQSSSAPRRLVRIAAPAREREILVHAIEKSPLLRAVDEHERPDEPAIARVVVEDERIMLWEPTGRLANSPSPFAEEEVAILVEDLRRMASAQSLRELESEPSDSMPENALLVEWGRVEDGKAIALKDRGELVPTGTRVYVRVRNLHPQGKTIHVSLFDVGVTCKITLLTRANPSGHPLAAGEEYVFGLERDQRTLQGQKLWWPKGMEKDAPRPERIIVIATEEPRDLSTLQAPGLSGTTRALGKTSRLEQLARQVQNGGTRDLSGEDEAEGYLVHHIDFLLGPEEKELRRFEGFLCDDRPPASVLAFAASEAAPAVARSATRSTTGPLEKSAPKKKRSRRISIQLTELVVHDVLTLFGSADIRLDALSITHLPDSAGQPFQAGTRRFQRIKDGDRLPLDNILLTFGDVRDFVDLRIWVSRDRDDSQDLADMIKGELGSEDFKNATMALLSLAAAAPQAAPIALGLGAAATIGQITWKILAKALPKTIGVYQTSLLAVNDFEVGRHPANGLIRAQDFSLGYLVTAVD